MSDDETVTDRGFTHWEPIIPIAGAGDGTDVVRFYESSALTAVRGHVGAVRVIDGPFAWLAIANSTAHLTFTEVEILSGQMTRWMNRHRPAAAVGRCQATTTGALFNEPNRCIWCELPSGHAGNHDAGIPQPEQPDARVSWPEPVAQPDPAGYVVVTRNPEGGLHRSATAWDDLERATAAGDFQARHAEGTGCTAAVCELREVNGDA